MAQKEKLFSIRNFSLVFSDNVRITIPYLDIYKGQITTFLGKSGSGKTTVLETLGLMRSVENENSEITFYSENEECYDYQELWNNSLSITQIRTKHFSFMFQDASFIDYLSVSDNIKLPKLLQYDSNTYNCFELNKNIEKRAITYNIDSDKLKQKTNIQSGGQQQRISFIRASIPEFNVLFADEPTGNLDNENAMKIFSAIKDNIETDKNKVNPKSAIIVTHHTKLAISFADRIVLIDENGKVGGDNMVFVKIDGKWFLENDHNENWVVDNDNHLIQLINKIEERISNKGDKQSNNINTKKIAIGKKINTIEPANCIKTEQKHFVQFLIKNKSADFKIYYKNWYFLIILFFSFIGYSAMGIVQKSLVDLDKKMNDPFINWINVVSYLKGNDFDRKEINEVCADLNEIKNANIDTVYTYAEVNLTLLKKDRGKLNFWGETIDVDDKRLNKINDFISAGKIYDKTKRANKGLIIKEEAIKKLGYNPKEIREIVFFNNDKYFCIPIQAIVTELPGESDFFCTPSFYNTLLSDNPELYGRIKVKVLCDSTTAKYFFNEFVSDFREILIEKGIDFNPSKIGELKVGGHYNSFSFEIYEMKSKDIINPFRLWVDLKDSSTVSKLIEEIKLQMHNNKPEQVLKAMRIYPFQGDNFPDDEFISDYFIGITILLNNLDRIESLRSLLNDKYGIKLSTEFVENSKNYRFVTNLTQLLSYIIIIIVVLFLASFMTYILYVHLLKYRKSIGLLYAFGASVSSLKKIYFNISFQFLIINSLLAFIISFFTFAGYLFIINDLSLTSWILFFNVKQLFLAIGTMLICSFSANKILINFLSFHPGELIYNRIKLGDKK